MSYTDSGFNKLLYRTTYLSSPKELTEDFSSYTTPLLTGTSVAGGVTKSQTGKIQIDWELGRILVGDGANWRVLIGDDGLGNV